MKNEQNVSNLKEQIETIAQSYYRNGGFSGSSERNDFLESVFNYFSAVRGDSFADNFGLESQVTALSCIEKYQPEVGSFLPYLGKSMTLATKHSFDERSGGYTKRTAEGKAVFIRAELFASEFIPEEDDKGEYDILDTCEDKYYSSDCVDIAFDMKLKLKEVDRAFMTEQARTRITLSACLTNGIYEASVENYVSLDELKGYSFFDSKLYYNCIANGRAFYDYEIADKLGKTASSYNRTKKNFAAKVRDALYCISDLAA